MTINHHNNYLNSNNNDTLNYSKKNLIRIFWKK